MPSIADLLGGAVRRHSERRAQRRARAVATKVVTDWFPVPIGWLSVHEGSLFWVFDDSLAQSGNSRWVLAKSLTWEEVERFESLPVAQRSLERRTKEIHKDSSDGE